MLTISKISELLSSRHIFSNPQMDEQLQPHPNWDSKAKAAIVILWGLLIYPQLDPDLQQNAVSSISITKFQTFFLDYLDDEQECQKILGLLNQYDYIRFEDNQILPGTGLYISVDAARMYSHFRSSVLARKLYQQMDSHVEK